LGAKGREGGIGSHVIIIFKTTGEGEEKIGKRRKRW
jgi:hypothetical protein